VTLSVVAPPAGPAANWRFPPPYGWRTVAFAAAALVLLIVTGHRVEMDRAAVLTGQAVAAAAGSGRSSQVAKGFSTVVSQLFPPQLDERTDVGRIPNLDRNHLPPFAHIETQAVRTQTLNPDTLQLDTVIERREVLVQPFGYVVRVGLKLLETLEIALWGTVLAIIVGLPLALLSARNLAFGRAAYFASRTLVSMFRAVPELISALFLVLAYGFGPIAGVLALAIHSAGFLGKFYAEDIENADPKPQEALTAIGAERLKVFRHAILPQVMPQYIAYTLYILDRNVRMATVIGLVGAGGIGQELKGRYDMYNYGHVGTILVAIFLLVLALDQLSSRLRAKLL
jgi:phosphonate transport system permease protein